MRLNETSGLQTARLTLEPLRSEHAGELERLLLDPLVARTIWSDPAPPEAADVQSMLIAKIEHWRRFGFGLWLMRERSTGEMVGRGGLQHTFLAGFEEVEAGWAVRPQRWGEGFATELAQACVQAAFGELRLREIVAFTLPHNLASRRVAEKVGFVFERDIEHTGRPHVLYRRGP